MSDDGNRNLGDRIESCVLTPQEKQQWGDTVSMMAWTCPGFRHLWYKLLNNNDGEHVAIFTRDKGLCANAATDGRNIIVNPDWFFKLGLAERTFVMGHEIVHNVFGDVELLNRCMRAGKVPMHDGTSLPFREDLMQKSMDYRINALLKESRIGKPPKDCGNFNDDVSSTDSVLDVYKTVYAEEGDDGDGGDNPGPGGNPGGFDNVMKPGQSTGGNPPPRNQQQWAVETAAAQAIEEMKSQGKMSAALKRMFEKILEPEVDWRDHIKTLINRIGASGGWNWKSPDPWWAPHDFFAPSKTGRGAGWIVIWGDTSGSRSDAEIASNIAELKGIMEDVNPQRLTMVWCDAAVTDESVVELTDPAELADLKPTGGGGTEVDPVFDWIRENSAGQEPDLFIGFTDGYVSFPERPKYPVIWASSTDKAYPYGQVVRVMKKGDPTESL